MADNTIDQSFVKEYETEVKVAFQRMGSLLMNCVRTKKNVKGSSARFQKYGKVVAGQKTRNGDVPFVNPDHSFVDVNLEDWYAGIPVDELDELATNNDERALAAEGGAAALGRKADDMIITAALTTSQIVGDYTGACSKALILQGLEKLDTNDVPQKGRFALLRPHAFNEFKNITNVSNRDYVGDLMPWLNGQEAFMWDGVTWMKHNGLPVAGSNGDSLLFHQTALGFASGQDVSTRIDWDTRAQGYNIVSKMKGQSALIDTLGVVRFKFKDDTAIT